MRRHRRRPKYSMKIRFPTNISMANVPSASKAEKPMRHWPAYITDRQTQIFRVPLDRIQAQPVGEAPQVDNSDQPADKQPDRRGERGSHQSPTQRKDEQVAERSTRRGSNQLHDHRQFGPAVQTDDEQTDGAPHLEHQRRNEPQ